MFNEITTRVSNTALTGQRGQTVKLPCHVAEGTCGEFHNIKWYRGSQQRVYVYSEIVDISRAEGPLENRARLEVDKNTSSYNLIIDPIRTDDEALYKCDITYLEIKEDCAVVHFTNLTTLAKPDTIRMSLADGTTIDNDSIVGPYIEGSELTLRCESGGGKPVPRVTWYKGSNEIEGNYQGRATDDGTGTGITDITMELSRKDLMSRLECQSNNLALDEPLRSYVTIDVMVPPLSVKMAGLDHPVNEGTLITLQCRADGAKPPANLTWFNGSIPLEYQPSEEATKPDGTFETTSRLTFTTTRWDNMHNFSCEASNTVLRAKGMKPLRAEKTLHVQYPPSVSVSPTNITVNESESAHFMCFYDANPVNLTEVIWYRNGWTLTNLDPAKYSGGTTDNPSLMIKAATREDDGEYYCEVNNGIGKGRAHTYAHLNVLYKPEVNLVILPMNQVNESDLINLTLTCEVMAGNPDTLTSVRWYLDGDLIKELPDCNLNSTQEAVQPEEDMCDIDPTRLLLEKVTRKFVGNYSCCGKNAAGWGECSEEEQVIVYYPPGRARLLHDPEVVKGSALTLTCYVAEPGSPPATTFRWHRGGYEVPEVTSSNWTIDPVLVKTESNYTCVAINSVGEGISDTVEIDVQAAPAFIERLDMYHGALVSATDISISCRVECMPLCRIEWYKDEDKINSSSPYYSIISSTLPPDPGANDFESVMSTLVWNMTHWPGGKLDRVKDNANYTCKSTGNGIGPGVASSTFFRVEYPPENITVSPDVVEVNEGSKPQKVRCSTLAYPEAMYRWIYKGETVAKGDVLFLDYELDREHAGNYTCFAQNRHGNITRSTFITVTYKPECTISQHEIDNTIKLICDVVANPNDVTFTWVKDENITLESGIETEGVQSTLSLEPEASSFGTYYCYANNSVGRSSRPCEIDIQVNGWLGKLGDDNLILYGSIIAGIVLLVLILLVCIFLFCRRRKRNKDKYSENAELEERENPEGEVSVRSVSKWPIKPGVHVHVNGSHSLAAGSKGKSGGPEVGTNSLPVLCTELSASPVRIEKKKLKNKLGVVTYRREPSVDGTISRKRKKPGDDLNSPNKSAPNDMDPDDRAFYENLPFHGLQNPPNKTPECSGSRPPSELSQPPSELSQNDGSSGYGSTRTGSFRSHKSNYGSLRVQPNKNLEGIRPHSSIMMTPLQSSKNPLYLSMGRSQSQPDTSQQIREMGVDVVDQSQIPSTELKVLDSPVDPEVPTPAPRIQTPKRHVYMNVPKTEASKEPQPLKPVFSDIDYADVNYRDVYNYGPINYKQASREAANALVAARQAEAMGLPARPPRRGFVAED